MVVKHLLTILTGSLVLRIGKQQTQRDEEKVSLTNIFAAFRGLDLEHSQ